MRYWLFVRPQCHLCLQVMQMLVQVGVAVKRVDIDAHAVWQQEYGALIPVLYDSEQDKELIFPFDRQALEAFIEKRG